MACTRVIWVSARSTYHLLGGHHDCLDAEAASTQVEQVLERGAQQVNDQDVVQAFLPEVVHLGYTNAPAENLVRPVLITQLRCVAFTRLEFDRNALVRQEVGAFEDHTKRALPDFLAHAVVPADNIGATRVRRGHSGTKRECDEDISDTPILTVASAHKGGAGSSPVRLLMTVPDYSPAAGSDHPVTLSP